ncbi:MAG: SDR family oxidoreductase [bacterium]|nr:SDR family oxidoreductase [bacterium]
MEENNYFVVGGSSGIGLEVVRSLSKNKQNVYVGSREPRALSQVSAVHHLALDVTTPSSTVDGLPDALDGLVYCPGTIRLRPFHRLKDEEFLEDFEINLMGAVRMIRLCLPKLKASKTLPSIVLFSTVAVQAGLPYHASIASAKGAVEGLTRALAAEFAPGIRVNAVAPSLTDTPLAARLLSTDEKRKAMAERHPLKRVGLAKDIAEMVLYLLSDKALWITGQVFHVDGGMSSARQPS